jgi:hypothetical protein
MRLAWFAIPLALGAVVLAVLALLQLDQSRARTAELEHELDAMRPLVQEANEEAVQAVNSAANGRVEHAEDFVNVVDLLDRMVKTDQELLKLLERRGVVVPASTASD